MSSPQANMTIGNKIKRAQMDIKLKHIKTTKKKLSDGSFRTYYYHRRTGARIFGQPGTPEFLQSYAEAEKIQREQPKQTLGALIHLFVNSQDYKNLAASTKKDYRAYCNLIDDKFGLAPIKVFEDIRIRGDFLAWRDEIGTQNPRRADYMWSVMRRLINFGMDRGQLSQNHFTSPGRLHKTTRRDKIWTPEKIQAVMAVASLPIRQGIVLAFHTWQRQGDLIAMARTNFNGDMITHRQSKTGSIVKIPCTHVLKINLRTFPITATTILASTIGRPWKSHNFRNKWRKAKLQAGIEDLTFHDIRGTCITLAAEAGCTPQEIAAISGHALEGGHKILDTYTSRTEALARTAIAKFENTWAAKVTTTLTTVTNANQV